MGGEQSEVPQLLGGLPSGIGAQGGRRGERHLLSEEEHGGFEVAIQLAELDPSRTQEPPQEPHTYMAQPRRTQRWLGLAQAARGCRVQRFGAAEKREEKRGEDASVHGGAGDGWKTADDGIGVVGESDLERSRANRETKVKDRVGFVFCARGGGLSRIN
jgi:hypothetical protein